VLGSGSFGRVVFGFNNDNGQVMAVKQVLLSELRNNNMTEKVKALECEIDILSNLNHKNIVRYLGTSRDEQYFNIFLEYEAGISICVHIYRRIYCQFDQEIWRV
jgi:mitogen-activated protein kinase kinase kinase